MMSPEKGVSVALINVSAFALLEEGSFVSLDDVLASAQLPQVFSRHRCHYGSTTIQEDGDERFRKHLRPCYVHTTNDSACISRTASRVIP